MTRAFGMTILAVVIASGISATAHHSNALYVDMSKAITLEGEVLRVEWINPHVLLFLQSKNDKGQSETWILHGSSLGNALRQVGSMKELLKPGSAISARVWPPRNPLFLNHTGRLADATRRRQKIPAHRRSRGDQVFQRRCCGHWRRTEVLKSMARTTRRTHGTVLNAFTTG